MFQFAGVSSFAEVEDVKGSGSCGDSLTWELIINEDGSTYTLTISGSGEIADYNIIAKSSHLDKLRIMFEAV